MDLLPVIAWGVAVFTVLGLFFGVALAATARRFHVATNPVISHHLTMPQSSPSRRLADSLKRGAKLIVLDPRLTQVARKADIHLQVRPGEDATLLAAMGYLVLTSMAGQDSAFIYFQF